MAILTKHVLMGKDIVRGALSGELLVADQAGGFASKNLDSALAALVAKIIADDATVAGDALAARNALSAAAAAESTARVAAEAAIQADVDANEADGDTDRALIRTEMATNETARDSSIAAAKSAADTAIANELAARLAAEGAIDARVDAILSGSSASLDQFVEVVAAYEAADGNLQTSVTNLSTAAAADRALVRSEFAAADTSAASFNLAARNAIITQHGVDDGLAATARGVIQADVDANEVDSLASFAAALAARNALSAAAALESTARQTAEALIDARVDAILSGSSASLDQFVEVVAAYEAADGNLQTSVTNLSTAAAADRALVRSEFAAADTSAASFNLAARNAIITQHGVDDGLAATARGVIQADVDANEVDSLASFAAALAARNALSAAATAESTARQAAEAAIDARVDAILSGSSASLDQFVEVVAAYEAADGNLQTSVTNLSTAAATDRAAIRSEFAAADTAESTARVAAEAAIQADVDQNESDSDAAHAAATAARGVLTAGLAQELLDRAADVDAEETRALAAEAANLALINAEKLRLDQAGGFSIGSDVPGGVYSMEWGAPGDSKPKMTFSIVGGVVTMSVELN